MKKNSSFSRSGFCGCSKVGFLPPCWLRMCGIGLFLLVLVNTACKRNWNAFGVNPLRNDAEASASLGEKTQVALGQAVQVGPVQVRYLEFIEDSRCPADQICVWEGRLAVKLESQETGSISAQKNTFDLILAGKTSAQQKSATFTTPSGYAITLVDGFAAKTPASGAAGTPQRSVTLVVHKASP